MRGLVIDNLTVQYGRGGSAVTAVDSLRLEVPDGAAVGLVGESGCGKSTLARAVVGLVPAAGGSIWMDGENVTNARGATLRALRSSVQMIFQDPFSSLNPRMRIGKQIEDVVRTRADVSRVNPVHEVEEFLSLVGLDGSAAARYPHQFSGGQRQRIAIARALAKKPRLLIADEPTSALDASVQATILNLLRDLRSRLGLSLLLISHNLAVVRYICDTVAVMYLGQIVEQGQTGKLFSAPRHHYARALLDSVPSLRGVDNPAAPVLLGDMPDVHSMPPGCRFHPRCPVGPAAIPSRLVCVDEPPSLRALNGGGGAVRCHFPLPAGDERPAEPAALALAQKGD